MIRASCTYIYIYKEIEKERIFKSLLNILTMVHGVVDFALLADRYSYLDLMNVYNKK
jgi:hypothetical protein